VRSAIDLAHNLDMQVTAEGVEDSDTWAALAALGCDYVQGYFVSPPMGADAYTVWAQAQDFTGLTLLPDGATAQSGGAVVA